MTETDKQAEQPADLRRRAEATVLGKALATEDFATLPPAEIHKTFHELRVHQIELEMQNEELRRTQAQLEAMKDRYCDLYDLAPVGYVTLSEKGLVEEANLTAASLLGLPRGMLLKQPFSRFICKEDQDIYYLNRKNALGFCQPRQIELRMVHPDGTLFWARLMITSPPRTNDSIECRVVLCDITERHQAEEALAESEERFRKLFQDVQNLAVQGYGPDGTTQYWNHASELLYGYPAEEAIGRHLVDLIIPPEMRAEVEQAIRWMVETGQPIPASEMWLMCKDGSRVPVFSNHTVVRIPGREPELFCIDIDLTERKLAEKALRESEEQYRLVFESASDAILLIDTETIEVLDANQRAVEIYGYSLDELLGMKSTDLSAEPIETLKRVYEARQNSDAIINIPLRLHRKKDGSVFPVEMTARIVPLKNRRVLFVAARDISERRHLEEALRQSEQRRSQAQAAANALLREQADSLASIYYALDSIGLIIGELEESDCRIAIFNSGAEKLLGYRQEEAVGRSIALIYPPELVQIIPGRVKKLRQGKSMQSFGMTLVRKSGERFPAIISLHPFDVHEGRFRKVVGVFRDISELMRAQEELKAINAELESRVEQRTRELQESQRQYLHAEKLSAIGQLSASIAHEFNNPLQGILSVLKGLKKRAILEDEDKALLEAAINEGDRIKDLIRSLQDFNRPSTGRPAVMDVHKSLDSILLLHKSDFNRKRIAVVRNYAENLPRILAVPDQIKQVFLNLLTNAADAFLKFGGAITLSTWEEEGRVAVAIKDTGVGIEPEAMERIFQPFYTTKAAVKGTGLGLSVCHGIVKQHQGEIRVESRPGEGTTFTVLLPVTGVGDPVSATEG